MISTILFAFRYVATCFIVAFVLYGICFAVGQSWVLHSTDAGFGRPGSMTVVIYASLPISIIVSPFVTLLILCSPIGKKVLDGK